MTDKNNDNSYAKITGNSVELFEQKFSLDYKLYGWNELYCPKYYSTGELESFSIKPKVFQYYDITGHREYTYELKENTFYIGGAIFFYESGLPKIVSMCRSGNEQTIT